MRVWTRLLIECSCRQDTSCTTDRSDTPTSSARGTPLRPWGGRSLQNRIRHGSGCRSGASPDPPRTRGRRDSMEPPPHAVVVMCLQDPVDAERLHHMAGQVDPRCLRVVHPGEVAGGTGACNHGVEAVYGLSENIGIPLQFFPDSAILPQKR